VVVCLPVALLGVLVIVCSSAVASAGVDRPEWGCRSFLRRVGGGMEWCDRVVRLDGVNQEDDRAWLGSDNKRSAPSQ
jgi:hypothetical protein